MTIDVISDVVCPWCFIGRRRLGQALSLYAAREPDVHPVVSWHPFQLNPTARDGIAGGLISKEFAARSAREI
jgi:predicted DsbA family dithiol-disulfide isomerase